MKLKGQTSIEFFLLFGISMSILAILFGAIEQKQSEVFARQNSEIASQVAENVGFQAEMALVHGKGYSRDFYLPRRIAGVTYNVSVSNKTVYIGWKNNFVTKPTMYAGDTLNITTETSNQFNVLYNDSGVQFDER
jgi:hypothetical protein